MEQNWHVKHKEERSFADKLADAVAAKMGSWKFIIIQTIFVVLWMILNAVGLIYEWDQYPFILLNLLFSTQAAYAAPIIMMSQNRQNDRDRVKAEADYETNIQAKLEIEQLLTKLDKIEIDKLDKIMEKLDIQEKILEGNEDLYQEAQRIYPRYSESSERSAFVNGVKWQQKQFKNK